MHYARTLALCALALASCSSDDASTPEQPLDASRPVDASVLDARQVDAHQVDAARGSADAAIPDAARAVDAGHDAGIPIDPAAEALHEKADRALADLMLNYWPSLRSNDHTIDWMYAHHWEALLDAAERRGPTAFAGTAQMFYELQEKRGWINDYYDDENWLTLTLLHAYELTNQERFLDRAKEVYADIMKAWDISCCGEQRGGLWWKKPMESKVTAINGGAILSGARLYEFTQEPRYLEFAERAYDFWVEHMIEPESGHVYDGFDNSGKINTAWRFTYNEGIFIGAIVALTRVTQDDSRLPLAHKIAGFMLASESAMTPAGRVLSDGKCSGDGEMFKGIGARYLGQLYALDRSHTEYRDLLRSSAEAMWTQARDPMSGRFVCDWAGPFDATASRVGSLGSAAVALAAAARAVGPGAQREPLHFEAEEANLQGPGVEAMHAGFEGWGYVAGWGNDGQSIAIAIDAPAQGTYELALRYGTVEVAQRTLRVGSVDKPVTFPRTAGYSDYQIVSTTVELARGANTLTISLDASAGGRGYLNLDTITLRAR
ncbi:MAG: glycoside hydrolase family 76 protein [Polyangiales bacterium]